MSEHEYGLARVARPRDPARLRRGTAVVAGIVATLMLTQRGGEPAWRFGPGATMPAAEASVPRGRDDLAASRGTAAGPAIAIAGPAAYLSAPPPPRIGSLAAAVPEAPVAETARSVPWGPKDGSPALLFAPFSLVDNLPQEKVDVPGMALRTETDPASPPDEGATDVPAPAGPARKRASARPDDASARLDGTWATNPAACGRRNPAYYPLVISGRGARAGGSSCAFGRTRQAGNRWAIAATCRNAAETWAANVRLVVEGRRLTWSSERGTETYTRCP